MSGLNEPSACEFEVDAVVEHVFGAKIEISFAPEVFTLFLGHFFEHGFQFGVVAFIAAVTFVPVFWRSDVVIERASHVKAVRKAASDMWPWMCNEWGFSNYMMDGFSGRGSADAVKSLEFCLKYRINIIYNSKCSR